MSQELHFGAGVVRHHLRAVLQRMSARSVFLVTGKASFESSGASAAVHSQLRDFSVRRFSDFSQNPKGADVERGLAEFQARPADAVVAVGGGSALDMAKLIAICAAQGRPVAAIVRNGQPVRRDAVPIVAIPTTAGSGSEATHFSAVYVEQKKHSVAHPSMLPRVALLDPDLTESAGPDLTAATGLDAFCQAVESFWSVHSTDQSRRYSCEAIGLVLRHLVPCVHQPVPEDRRKMCQAAHLAGKAIDITRTTAPHAISYGLTSRWGVPHGHAVALTLGPMLIFNSLATEADVADPRGATYVRAMMAELFRLLGCERAEACRLKISGLMRDAGLATRLGELGLKTGADRHFLVEQVDVERLQNNPRTVSRQQLREVLESVA